MTMRIFLTGATGFIGNHVLKALRDRGYSVTCLIRKGSKDKLMAQPAAQDLTAQNKLEIVCAEWTRPEHWLEYVAGHAIVINAVGIIRERNGGDFEAIHSRAPIALFQQAAKSGASKIIQISAMGADDLATSKFHISKRAADRFLSQLTVPYVVIRPSFVYGTGGSSMSFFGRLAKLPITPVPGSGDYCVQPIHVDDLTKAIVIGIEREDLYSSVVDAGGSEILTFDQMLGVLGRRAGKSVTYWHVPWTVMRVIGTITDILGGHGLISTEELAMLRRGNCCSSDKFVEFFGFRPVSFSQGITRS